MPSHTRMHTDTQIHTDTDRHRHTDTHRHRHARTHPSMTQEELCGCGNPNLTTFFLCLTEMLRDKNRPVTAAHAKGPRGRKKKHGEMEEPVEPELEASSLETCKDLLRATLTHWGPVVPLPGPTQESVGQVTLRSKALEPAYAAVSLVASWVLRSLAERPLSRAEVTRLLDWLTSHVLPYPVVVADFLRDSAVKSGIFKLYSHHCSLQGLLGPALDVACKFSAVMLQLLVAQGRIDSPFHSVVEALCLDSLNEKDEAKRGNVCSLVTFRGIRGVGEGGVRKAFSLVL